MKTTNGTKPGRAIKLAQVGLLGATTVLGTARASGAEKTAVSDPRQGQREVDNSSFNSTTLPEVGASGPEGENIYSDHTVQLSHNISVLESTINEHGTLHRGSRSEGVKSLQYIINLVLPEESLESDGVYGPKTEQAVATFQRFYNQRSTTGVPISIDGKFGRESLKAMKDVLGLTDKKIAREPSTDGTSVVVEESLNNSADKDLAMLLPWPHPLPKEGIVPYSRMLEHIDNERDLKGRSRAYADADDRIRVEIMKLILDKSKEFDLQDQATILAIVAYESGFNPDAATPSTSAAGLFQIVRETGYKLGLREGEFFSAEKNIEAGLKLFRQ